MTLNKVSPLGQSFVLISTPLKPEGISPKGPVSRDDARRLIADYVNEYNRLLRQVAAGYITPRPQVSCPTARVVGAGFRPLSRYLLAKSDGANLVFC